MTLSKSEMKRRAILQGKVCAVCGKAIIGQPTPSGGSWPAGDEVLIARDGREYWACSAICAYDLGVVHGTAARYEGSRLFQLWLRFFRSPWYIAAILVFTGIGVIFAVRGR